MTHGTSSCGHIASKPSAQGHDCGHSGRHLPRALELWGDFKEEAVSGQDLNNEGEFTNKGLGKGWRKGEDHAGDKVWHRS